MSNLKVLDFYAKWCGQCRKLTPIIDELALEYKDIVEFEKINADDYKLLVDKYGVCTLPCLVFLKNNNDVLKMTGMPSKSKLISKINEFLE